MFNRNNKFAPNDNRVRINDQIRCPTVLLIKDDQKLGVMPIEEARRIARESGLDLVEVVAQAHPPVCKIIDYGKFRYEQNLKEKDQKKKQKSSQIKELRISPSIGEHDLMVKINSAKKFLLDGHRVHFSLRYDKRENAHKDLGFVVVDKIIVELREFGTPQTKPKLEGSYLNCFLDPVKKNA